MLAGSVFETLPATDRTWFFIFTGAFHTANNTYDIYKRYYFAHSTNTYDDTYRYWFTDMDLDPAVPDV